jgi:acetylornithine deacetylase/succinyl-diaminopimelate desuccinylase-like protein
MHDDAGKVRIPGFYDDIKKPSARQREQWAELGFDDRAFLAEVGLSEAAGERRYGVLSRSGRALPSSSTASPAATRASAPRTVIPARASVKITCRLVPGQDPKKIQKAIESFVKARLPKDCRAEFLGARGSKAIAFDATSRHLTRAAQALEAEWGRPTALIGMGGSIPIVTSFKEVLGMDSCSVGFGLDDDRIHFAQREVQPAPRSARARAAGPASSTSWRVRVRPGSPSRAIAQ